MSEQASKQSRKKLICHKLDNRDKRLRSDSVEWLCEIVEEPLTVPREAPPAEKSPGAKSSCTER
jgi:hypothetical protein